MKIFKLKKIINLFKCFNSKIYGQENAKKIDTSKMTHEEFGDLVLEELGGINNLLTVDSCITRLRLQIKDITKINRIKLEELGSDGIIKIGEDKVQIIFGEKSVILEKYYHKLKNR